MYIQKIKLENFRNYKKAEIEFDKNINIIYGDNAQGKTNILESIFVCSLGKSFRTNKDKELINKEKDFSKIEMISQKKDRDINVKFEMKEKKKFYINNIPVKKTSEIIGKTYIVLFTPEDIGIINNEPSKRRRFLNIMISQLRPLYINLLSEYNKILVDGISFKELLKALKNEDGRKILANYGLDPKLGKYHRTYCDNCEKNIEGKPPVTHCDTCDSRNITMGVLDRIEMIKDKPETKSPENRPPYIYQIPLTFIPGLGNKTIEKLLDHFETEMNILHKLSKDDIEAVVGEKVANSIVNAREGNVHIHAGGGGVYGKIENK